MRGKHCSVNICLCDSIFWIKPARTVVMVSFRLGLNSFEKDVSGAVMDIEADEEEGMRTAKAIKKW